MGSHLRGGAPLAMPPWRSIFEDTESNYVFFDELKEIPRRFPDIDLALLHLGGAMFFGVLAPTEIEFTPCLNC